MAELNRTDDQLTTTNLTDRSDKPRRLGGTEDWIEDDSIAAPRTARPVSVRNDTSNLQDDWNSTTTPLATTDAVAQTPLLLDSEVGDLRSRWSTIQAEFVDEPRRSVQQADKLVATAMQRLADGFANERASLEKQWESGDNVSTEDLRVALQRYRAFFGRLLNAA
jgi:hypothetical protein